MFFCTYFKAKRFAKNLYLGDFEQDELCEIFCHLSCNIWDSRIGEMPSGYETNREIRAHYGLAIATKIRDKVGYRPLAKWWHVYYLKDASEKYFDNWYEHERLLRMPNVFSRKYTKSQQSEKGDFKMEMFKCDKCGKTIPESNRYNENFIEFERYKTTCISEKFHLCADCDAELGKWLADKSKQDERQPEPINYVSELNLDTTPLKNAIEELDQLVREKGDMLNQLTAHGATLTININGGLLTVDGVAAKSSGNERG